MLNWKQQCYALMGAHLINQITATVSVVKCALLRILQFTDVVHVGLPFFWYCQRGLELHPLQERQHNNINRDYVFQLPEMGHQTGSL